MSARRLGVLVRQLPATSATTQALNGGQTPWSRSDHLIADVWALWAKKDHPVRAELEEKARRAAKQAKVVELREKRNRTHRLGVTE